MTASDAHFLRSSYREMLLEHLFAGEVMRHLWLTNSGGLEVLKPQVDDSGYDIVFDAGHGPTLYQSGLPGPRRLDLVATTPLRNGAVAMHYRRPRD